ncbi:MAG: hypothetical protein NZM44_04195 [Candidatus Calescibacterium sp.]|nr:hypothetical protein [Candidatus Calescibacterium sp.]
MMDLGEIDKFCQKIDFGGFETRIINYPFKRCFIFPKVIVLDVQNVLEYSKELIQRNPHIESHLSFDNTF